MLGIFLDQETTGLDPTKHAVVEIAFKIVDLTNCELLVEYSSIVCQPQSAWEGRDPASIVVNGFSWEQVQQGKPIEEVSQEILEIFSAQQVQRGKAVFICQNPAFDRPFFGHIVDVYTQEKLNWPYHWLDLASMFFALQMQKRQDRGERVPLSMNLSKDEIAKHYGLPCEAKPHRAMNGVDHLILCYETAVNHQPVPYGKF